MKQLSFAGATYANKKIVTNREKFLNEMEEVVPWERLLKLIEPHYPKKGKWSSTDADAKHAADLLSKTMVRTI